MMPKPDQSIDAYIQDMNRAAGVGLPRASSEDIARLQDLGYSVMEYLDGGCFIYQAHGPDDWFQDVAPSYCSEDAWAVALAHSKEAH